MIKRGHLRFDLNSSFLWAHVCNIEYRHMHMDLGYTFFNSAHVSVHSHSRGGDLDASVGHQVPVVPLAGAQRTLPGFLVDLHLKRLHVRLVFLIGCQAHSWEGAAEHAISLILQHSKPEDYLVSGGNPSPCNLLIRVTFHFSNFSVVLQCLYIENMQRLLELEAASNTRDCTE